MSQRIRFFPIIFLDYFYLQNSMNINNNFIIILNINVILIINIRTSMCVCEREVNIYLLNYY